MTNASLPKSVDNQIAIPRCGELQPDESRKVTFEVLERVLKYIVCCLSEYTYGQPVSFFDKTQHVATAFEIYNVVYSAREILMVSYKTSLRDFGMSPSYSYRSRHARTQIRYTVYDEVSSVVACYVSLTPGST